MRNESEIQIKDIENKQDDSSASGEHHNFIS